MGFILAWRVAIRHRQWRHLPPHNDYLHPWLFPPHLYGSYLSFPHSPPPLISPSLHDPRAVCLSAEKRAPFCVTYSTPRTAN